MSVVVRLSAEDLILRMKEEIGLSEVTAERIISSPTFNAEIELDAKDLAGGLVRRTSEAMREAILTSMGEMLTSEGLRLVIPPQELVEVEPTEMKGDTGLTRRLTAFKAIPTAQLNELKSLAETAITWFEEREFKTEPVPSGLDPTEYRLDVTRRFLDLLTAADAFSFVSSDNRVTLAGELPEPLEIALSTHINALELDDLADYDRVLILAQSLGFTPPVDEPLEPLGQELLNNIVTDVALFSGRDNPIGRMFADDDVDRFLLEGSRRASYSEEEQLPQIPEGYLPPGLIPGEPTALPYGNSIVLVTSDRHSSHEVLAGNPDEADDATDPIEKAHISLISAWQEEVEDHRRKYGPLQQAILVCNGDDLDMWAADLRGGSSAELDPDVAFVRQGSDVTAKVNRVSSYRRLGRILQANEKLVNAIYKWVDSHPLNYCYLIGGNHDDHLERYKLGEEAARAFHPSRAAYVAKRLYMPQLSAAFEHGHRGDEFNTLSKKLKLLTSLGEVMVSLLVNPLERGGLSLLKMIEAQTGDLSQIGLSKNTVVTQLNSTYSRLRQLYGIDSRTWKWLGAVDNLTNEGDLIVVAKKTRDELKQRNPELAEQRKVEELPDLVRALASIWLKDDYQMLAKRILGPAFVKLVPARLGGYLYSWARRKPQRETLGFDSKTGLPRKGSPAKILVVGHTHQPSDTFPKIEGKTVPAQFVNTGTGQHMWDVAVSEPIPFAPAERDNACILKRVFDPESQKNAVEVISCNYRSEPGKDPRSPGRPIGFLKERARNTVPLI